MMAASGTGHTHIGRKYIAGTAYSLDQGRLFTVILEQQAQAADLYIE
jgi:hypothetical protein